MASDPSQQPSAPQTVYSAVPQREEVPPVSSSVPPVEQGFGDQPQEWQQAPQPETPPQTPSSQTQDIDWDSVYTNQAQQIGAVQPQPEYLIMEWIADSRVGRRRSKEYYSSLAVIVLLVSLILFFAGQILLIFVVLAFLFISYVLSSVRAESVHHQITSYGIRYRVEKLIFWNELGRFWVRDNHGIPEIHIEAPTTLGNEILLLPSNAVSGVEVSVQEIIDILSRYLVYQEPIPSQLDRWVLWAQEKFPLE